MEYNGPEEFRPISMWGYFGYQILYSIPVVGLVFLIIHALSNQNINRRNFARSFFCVIIIALILGLISYFSGAFSIPTN